MTCVSVRSLVKELVPVHGLRAWRAFLKAHAAAVSEIEADLEERGMVSLTWYDVLLAINSAPGGQLRMGAIAEALVLTRSNATRLVDKLALAGLLQRGSVEEDGRGSAATLTAYGRRALRRAWPVYAAGIKRTFVDRLRRRELEVVAETMTRVEDRAKAVPRRRRP